MAIKLSSKGSITPFQLCPQGVQQAVCCDVLDHGYVKSSWGKGEVREVHKITLRWQSIDLMPDGRPYMVQRRYTASLNAKAALRRDIGSWRGKPLTEKEAEDFDAESVIGWNCFIQVVHADKGSRGIFAEVVSIMALPRGVPLIEIRDYVRVVNRPREDARRAAGAATPAAAPAAQTPPPNAGEAWEPPAPAEEEPPLEFDDGDPYS